GPPAQLADPQVPTVRCHAGILQTLYRLLTIIRAAVRSLDKPCTKGAAALMRKLSQSHRPRRATMVISLVVAALLVPAGLALGRTGSSAPARGSTPERNLVQTAAAAGDFKTLVSLVKRAGLTSALSGKTKLTVFAPTDAAFKKVPKATLDKLLAD